MGCPLPDALRTVVLAGVVIAAGAGCGGGPAPSGPPASPAPSPSTPAPPYDVAADTLAVCGRLGTVNAARSKAFKAKWAGLVDAVEAGDEAAGAAASDAAKQELQDWAEQLDVLAADAGNPAVRAAIVRSSALVARLASDEDRTPVDQVLPKVAEVDREYVVACARPTPSP
jgi:hypothetical protein